MAQAVRRPSWQLQLPNALTLARVGLAAALFAVLAFALDRPEAESGLTRQSGTLIAAALLFILAAITDALDGHLARKWQVASRFGRVMDPFADKLLVLGSFVFLAGPAFASPDGYQVSGLEPWMAVVILSRELLVTTLRGVYEAAGIDFSATASGKLKMILQSISVPAILVLLAASSAGPGSSARWSVLALAWSVTLVTAWSGVPYVVRAVRAGREGA